MSESSVLQNLFFDTLVNEEINVSIFLMNGIKLHGVIEAFDEHVVLLKNAVTQMIFKHAISTVVPTRMITVTVIP